MFVSMSDCSPNVNSEISSLFGWRLSWEESAVRARRSAREWPGPAEMAGDEECWEVSCRSAVQRALEVLLGVLVLPEEDLTVSGAGKFAGLRITDGVGKNASGVACLLEFIVHWRGPIDEPLFASF